jgi:hypothetical protein
MKILLLLFSVVSILTFSQSEDSLYRVNRLDMIYRNLEYNTTAFNDLKKIWVVTDPVFIREIFNRFVVRNALTINGKKPGLKLLEQKAKDIYSGDVFVELRKRYYDEEIEELRFFTESNFGTGKTVDSVDYFFDPIKDYIFIKEVLGDVVYEDIKEQFYAFNNLTKSYYDNKAAYNFDIKMNIVEPEVMFWSTTTNEKNKYLVSFFGKWGNDYIVPGWYMPYYIAGVKANFIDYLVNNSPHSSYTLNVGFGLPTKKQPFIENDIDEVGRRLFHSGSNIYFRVSGNPLNMLYSQLTDIDINIEGSLTLSQLKASDYSVRYKSQFYSTRNYFIISAKYKNLMKIMDLGLLGAGLGFSTYDVNHFLLDPDINKLVDLESSTAGRYKNQIMAEATLQHNGGLLNHDISFLMTYNLTENNGYIGTRANFMISSTIGIDFRFFSAYRFTSKSLPFYRTPIYIVFSPIIRINY